MNVTDTRLDLYGLDRTTSVYRQIKQRHGGKGLEKQKYKYHFRQLFFNTMRLPFGLTKKMTKTSWRHEEMA